MTSGQNAYEMFRFLNFRNLLKKTEKHTELLSFGQTYIKFHGCHGNTKYDSPFPNFKMGKWVT